MRLAALRKRGTPADLLRPPNQHFEDRETRYVLIDHNLAGEIHATRLLDKHSCRRASGPTGWPF